MNKPRVASLPSPPGPLPIGTMLPHIMPMLQREFARKSTRLLDILILSARVPLRTRPRNGKIARLPESNRKQINHLLDDGLTYRAILDIIAKTADPPLPYPLSEMNISNWFRGGFQDWRYASSLSALEPLSCSGVCSNLQDFAPAKGLYAPPPTPALPPPTSDQRSTEFEPIKPSLFAPTPISPEGRRPRPQQRPSRPRPILSL
jgi:hypothetical protein